jgi:hypothetical protein
VDAAGPDWVLRVSRHSASFAKFVRHFGAVGLVAGHGMWELVLMDGAEAFVAFLPGCAAGAWSSSSRSTALGGERRAGVALYVARQG